MLLLSWYYWILFLISFSKYVLCRWWMPKLAIIKLGLLYFNLVLKCCAIWIQSVAYWNYFTSWKKAISLSFSIQREISAKPMFMQFLLPAERIKKSYCLKEPCISCLDQKSAIKMAYMSISKKLYYKSHPVWIQSLNLPNLCLVMEALKVISKTISHPTIWLSKLYIRFGKKWMAKISLLPEIVWAYSNLRKPRRFW